jgi:predicted transcriptional regulator
MKTKTPQRHSRREREIMDIVYRLGRATAAEVRQNLASPPSYSSVRGTLSALERKGHLTHEFDGNRYVYRPTVQRETARISALDHLLTTFFDGSAAAVVAALLEERRSELSPEELDELSKLIEETRKEGR